MVAPSFSQGVNLWEVVINPINLKSKTLPLASLRNQYSINFHLAWLGFFSAFLSWFAFSPLIPDAIKQDLKLTPAQIGNSNVVALCATLFVRVLAGPLIDRSYDPIYVSCHPHPILGVGWNCAHCQRTLRDPLFHWYSWWNFRSMPGMDHRVFRQECGWDGQRSSGRLGQRRRRSHIRGHDLFIQWFAFIRARFQSRLACSFCYCPVPFLLLVATAVMVFGTDHPAGKWSDRHKAIAHASDSPKLEQVFEDERALTRPDESNDDPEKKGGLADVQITVAPVEDSNMVSELDYAVNEPLTTDLALKVISTPLTWLPALAYFTTFGFELAIDANLANILLSLYKSKTFGQTKAGYIASIFGLLNIFSRPLGGYFGDLVYRRWGVPGKKHLLIFFGILQGLLSLGLGIYIDSHHHPSLAVVIVFLSILALANEAANGVNFSLVPHCNPCSNGFMSGMVGGMGNFGGIVFAMVFRFQPAPVGKAFWISGIIAMVGVTRYLCQNRSLTLA
ncbi:major facilitator superfamily domain-containing protein [Boletus reticuloceps]|uniref:Major facilitator superfamily domain-containing protein n=1 Tax=Boletus reticuloceps TaxID=495285 RepID=A0A8I2YUM3_9AGAM|nr:major facilitator superfamily domain-containing protein [Boletus reticuloceps]